jgi:hypothetical protein
VARSVRVVAGGELSLLLGVLFVKLRHHHHHQQQQQQQH